MAQDWDVTYVGPMPPPMHGKSFATAQLATALRKTGLRLKVVNITEGVRAGILQKTVRKVISHLNALGCVVANNGPVYISANSGTGMWLSIAVGALARLLGREIYWHHHSYDYVRRRRLDIRLLASLSGKKATHMVLAKTMGDDLMANTLEIKRTFVLNNAGFISPSLLDIPIAEGKDLVIGHLSNLTAEKGIAEVVDLAVAVRQAGQAVRLIVAGPTHDIAAQNAIARAEAALGDAFIYRGPVYDADKIRFFSEITFFAFPSRYRNEASPIVLFEAMAAGVPCIATPLGCVPDDLGTDGGMVISADDDFVAKATDFIQLASHDVADRAQKARGQYLGLLREHDKQLAELAALLSQG